MEGVYLNGKHSYSDFGLILERAEIGPAVPNTYYVDVPFGKRQDITEALYGDVTYSYREIVLSLGIKKGHEAWQGFLSRFYNLYNGQKIKLIFDNDASYYYVGRAEFSTPERECRIGKFAMTLNCEPYKYKVQKTVISGALSAGNNQFNLKNGRMPTRVSVVCTGDIHIIISNDGGEKNLEIKAGTHTIIDPMLTYGDNNWIVTGSGNVAFTYQEGDL